MGTDWLEGSEGPVGSERKAAEWLANEGGCRCLDIQTGQVKMLQRDVCVCKYEAGFLAF